MLYHGSHNNLFETGKAHEGMCFTESLDVAENYGDHIYVIEEIEGLTIEDCEGYDREENEAPGS